MENKVIDKLAWIYLRDGKILMARSSGRDVFYFPGGGREEGETDLEALIREIKEELLVDIIPETAVYYGTFSAPAHGRAEGTLVQVTCYTADFVGDLKPDGDEIAEFDWLTSADKERTTPAGILVFDDLLAKGLIT